MPSEEKNAIHYIWIKYKIGWGKKFHVRSDDMSIFDEKCLNMTKIVYNWMEFCDYAFHAHIP